MSKEHNAEAESGPADLSHLPPGWCWTTLATIADIDGGITKDQKRRRTPTMREVPYLRVANVQRNYLDLQEMKTILAEEEEIVAMRLRKGDVLFTEGGDRDKLGRGWVWNDEIEECIHQNHIFRARLCLPLVEPRFVSYHGNFFGQQWFTATGKQTTNLASINKGVLSRFPVPLAPLNEQQRIVAKIEELFSDLDAGVAALERIKANLKRYRATVLKAAVEGTLTEQWRAKHPKSEPASKLLERILAERRQKWEKNQLAKFAAADKTPPKGWREKYVEPTGPDTRGLPELPQGWCWATVDQLLIESTCNGISIKGTDAPPGVAALRLSAMSSFGFNYEECRYIPISEGVAAGLAIHEGDFFVSRGNGSLHLLGRGTLAQAPPGIVVFPDTMIRLRFSKLECLPRFMRMIWESKLIRKQIEKKARTTAGIYKISQRDIEAFCTPLAQLVEQEEILLEVERCLSIVKEAEAQVDANLKRAARLRQCILKRAYEGRLVPQEPTDEPADKLLERIRQERTVTNGSVPQRRRSGRVSNRQAKS